MKGINTQICSIDGTAIRNTRLWETALGKEEVILGYPWLCQTKPQINWKEGTINFKANAFIQAMTATTTIGNGEMSTLPIYCCPFLDRFEKKASERLPERRKWDHSIDLKPDFVPKDCKIYPLPPLYQTELDTFLKENLWKGYIHPSKSPMASPFFFIGKKDRGLRPCQDYRKLNEGTIKNHYPLPLISKLVDKLKGAKYFTKLDLQWGYNNVWIREGDEWKTAFKTNKGLFKPTILFFGLCNAPATFQQIMNDILKDMIDKEILVVYMDDILLFAKDKESLKENTIHVLKRLVEHDLFLKPEKCSFKQEEIKFLGMIIKEGKKDLPFQWGIEQQKAFDTLKGLFLSKPILLAPDTNKPFLVETDASKVATGGVLKQQDFNGDWHLVAYLSQSLDPAQSNYQIYDQELLAIIRALQAWRQYLLGNQYTTMIYCDHQNLTYYREPQKLTPRQACWQIELSHFNIRLVHKPGKALVIADVLSRRPDLNVPKSTEKSTLLPPSVFISKINTNTAEEIRKAPIQDDRIQQVVKGLTGKSPLPQHIRKEDWMTKEGLVYY
ncbi:hypothetical protein AX16_008709 [Volvariella volvacea WC 439]|nr:hypothetical protein AX16_008709 [Volvariella volvacea WC 439]